MLTASYPAEYGSAYFPLILELSSDVRDDFTTGSAKTITNVANNLGFAELTFSSAHSLVKGDYILVTSAPGATSLLGVALVKSVPTTTTVVLTKGFPGPLSANGTAYRYLNNYNAVVRVYVNTQTSDNNLVAIVTLKPKFVAGFCVFTCDLSTILQGYSFNGNDALDFLDKDLFPPVSNPFCQHNTHSYVEYYTTHAEAYDNPVTGEPAYTEQTPQE